MAGVIKLKKQSKLRIKIDHPALQHAEQSAASLPWTTGWTERLPVGLSLLDVACGSGALAVYAANRGFKVTAVDRDRAALDQIKNRSITVVCADIENADIDHTQGSALAGQFDCVVVNRYLWRPRWFQLMRWLKPDGVLIYETFANGHAQYGRPKREDFLLRDGELVSRCIQSGLQVIAFEDGVGVGVGLGVGPVRVQRICAIGPHRKRDSLLLK